MDSLIWGMDSLICSVAAQTIIRDPVLTNTGNGHGRSLPDNYYRAVKITSKSGCPKDNHFSKHSCPHRIFGCPHTKKECWLPGNIIKCLVYFVVPMNAAVHVMCFYYSS